jgi:NADPH2:quinone reductase
MRALLCESWDGWQAVRYTDVERPELKPGCVRIQVHYATLGFAQLLVVAGKYQRKPPLPFVPGTEVSGVVTDVAQDVSGFRPGDRVAALLDWGGFGEEAIATAVTTWHVPASVHLSQACMVPVTYGTSWAALHWRAHIEPGQTVVVFGAAGGVGMSAVQIARQAGAHVIAVARTDERLAVACESGAHEGVLADTPELGRVLRERCAGRGADIVYDPVGGDAFDEALRCVAPEGRVIIIGFAGGVVQKIPANLLLVKNVEVTGLNFGHYAGWSPTDERHRYAGRMKAMMERLFEGIQAGQFRPSSSAIYPLQQYPQACESISQRSSTGRVVLEVRG